MPIINLTMYLLLFSLVRFNTPAKEYYIWMKNTDYPNKKLIRDYRNKAFGLEYDCKCYAAERSLSFHYDGKEENVWIIPKPPTNVITLDQFAVIANKARINYDNLFFANIYMIEQIGKNTFVKYKVRFFPSELEE